MELTVAQLAERLGAQLVGQRSEIERMLSAVGPVDAACQSDITFVTGVKHKPALQKSLAGAVIVDERIEGLDMPQLVVEDVQAALIEALKIFAPKLKPQAAGIDQTAKLGQDVKVEKGVSIGPYVVIDDRVQVGENTVVAAGCKIGQNSKIGRDCCLDRNVVIYHNCTLGDSVIIQANTTIGSMGFGYSFIDGSHKLIPHNGGVVIEDFVEIGANCCVDRAKFGNTIIGAGTKIDNLVQIAHNVVIGKACLIAGQVGISGSCRIGDGVVLAGQVGLTDNIEIGSGTMVGAQAGVMNDVKPGQKLAWSPAIDYKQAMRVLGTAIRLPKLAEQIKQLNKRVERLEERKT